VDADTLRLEVDLGLDVRHRLVVRLAGVDAPEMATEAGKAARTYTRQWLYEVGVVDTASGEVAVVIRTHKDKREKYGRYLADVFSVVGDRSLNLDLVTAGHARPYEGGPRGPIASQITPER